MAMTTDTMSKLEALTSIAQTVLRMRYAGSAVAGGCVEAIVNECGPLVGATPYECLKATCEIFRRYGDVRVIIVK